MAFVTGEAGQGKTSLLREFARRAQADRPDLVVALGVCDSLSGVGDAYLPFRDVIAMLTGDVETLWSAGDITRDHALRLWRLLPATARAIVEQAPDLLGPFVSAEALTRRIASLSPRERSKLSPLPGQLIHLAKAGRLGENQSQLFSAYTEFLKTAADQHPVLLILDDLQWVDIASVNLLFHLVRRIGESRILIVGAYRPEDVNLGRGSQEHPLQALLGELRRLSGDIWVELDQKGQAESREFVDALLDREPNRLGERFRQEMTHHTQANPLFTVELLRYMQDRGDLAQDEMGYWRESPGLGWDTFPAKVEGVIENRVGRLKPELRYLLAAASVEGEDFTAEVVGSALGLSQQQVLEYLSQELEKQHRLVRERGAIVVGRRNLSRFRFGHILFQRYLYETLGEGQRRLLHGEIARALEGLCEGRAAEIASQLTFHFLEAGDREKALVYAHQAARRAQAVYAHEEAIQHLQTALDLLETDERVATRLELLEELADVHRWLANKAQAISHYQAALDLWSSLAGADRMIAVRLHRKILETLLVQWDETLEARPQTLAASRSYLEARLPLAESEQPQVEWVRVLIALANIADIGFMSPENLDKAESYAQAAVELADQLDAPEELSDALEILGGIQFVRGRLHKRLELSRRGLALSQDPRFGDPRKRGSILESHSDALMAVGEYAQAMRHLLEMEELAVQSRNVASQVWALSLQALCLYRLDRWEALFELEEKLRQVEQRSARDQLAAGGNCVVLSIGAAARALRGDLDQARVMREQAYAIMASGSGGSTENWGRTQFY
jgi:tetratricopeptide (TPR) repeat protein